MSGPEQAAPSGDPPGDRKAADAESLADGLDHQTGEALESAVARLGAIGRDLIRMLDLLLERARLAARTGGYRLLLSLCLAVVAAMVSVLAAYFFMDGLAGGAAELLAGRAWAGRLFTGLLVLLLMGAVLWLYRSRSRKAHLKRLKRKYARGSSAADPGEGGSDG